MASSRLIDELAKGLKAAQTEAGHGVIAAIVKETGVSRATVERVLRGTASGMKAETIEALWSWLARYGYMGSTFDFSVCTSLYEKRAA